MSEPKVAHGPSGHLLLGHLPAMRRDALGFFLDSAAKYGDVVRMRLGPYRAHLIAHPDGVRHVLQEHNKAYDKKTPGAGKARELLGNGLVQSDGAFWLRQRRLMQPSFHRERIAGFLSVVVSAVERLSEAWSDSARRGEVRDVLVDFNGVALEVAGRTLLGDALGPEAKRVRSSVEQVMSEITERFTRTLDWPSWLPTPSNRRLSRALGELDAVVARLVSERRDGPPAADLLSMLVSARDEGTGEGMSPAQLRDEVMTILVAGHETTGSALAWAFDLLAATPSVVSRLRAESASVLGAAPLGLEALRGLRYVRATVDEVLRLYPPGWFLARRAREQDEIGGFAIPKGSLVFVSPWVTHRHPSVWVDPGRFHPDRFLEEAVERPRFAYFPFGGGPRQCIGVELALMELRVALVLLASRFDVERVEPPRPPDAGVTLRPRGGLRLRIRAAAPPPNG